LLPAAERTEALDSLSSEQAHDLLYDWDFWARDAQLPPDGSWNTWLYQAGRGAGKTRTAAEWIRQRVNQGCRRIALVGKTPADVRDTMIEGESGILAISTDKERPHYEPSKRRLTWPDGAIALAFSGAEPDQLRGPQFDTAWIDELASFHYPRQTWDNLLFALRLGDDPKVAITTTPKPISLLKEIASDPSTIVTRESSYANRLNLTSQFFDTIISRYEGTRTGRQEIYADLLEEADGALWTRQSIDANRVAYYPELTRIVVAIDPAVTATEQSDETGIVVCGVVIDHRGQPEGYILDDASGRYTPQGWATKAVSLYREWKADLIIGEVNNGGDMIEHTLRTIERTVIYRAVHASRGKAARAEPVAALYEQNKVHHVGGFPELEDQLVSWEPLSGDKSPDRLDALVWGLTSLMLNRGSGQGVSRESKTSAWDTNRTPSRAWRE
jgi:phage terminase large subunit-like protein